MQFAIIGVLCVVAFLAVTGLAYGTPIGTRFATALGQARLQGANLIQATVDAYEEYIQPSLRRMGYVALAALALGFIAACVVLGSKVLNIFALLLGAATAIGVFFIIREMRRRPVDFSIFALAQAIFVALLGEGVALFLLGHATRDRQTVLLGIALILMAREVLFLVFQVVARIAALGVDVAEGGSNLVLNLAVKLLTVGTQGLKDVFGAQGVNIANQERFVPAIRHAKLRINSLLLPVLVMGLLMPSFFVLFAVLLAGTVSSLTWGKLEAEDIATKARRQRSALTLEFLGYLLLLPALALIAFPDLQGKIDTGYDTFEGWVVNSAEPERIAYLLLAVVAGAAAYLWKSMPTKSMRLLAGVASLISLGCFGYLVWMFISTDAINIARAATNGVLMEFTPKVKATKDGVAISWPEYPGNKGYNIERRELHETTFNTLVDISGTKIEFDRDAKQWEDTSPVRGKTYFYRVIALKAAKGGDDLASEEQRVEVPLREPPSTPSSNPSSKPPAPVVRRTEPKRSAPCADESCGMSPALSELCRRYPASCAGK